MLFWIVATALSLVVAVTLLAPLLRRGPADNESPATAIYRDQLAEVDRDVARGILAADEADRARTEIARRLLDVAGSDAKTAAEPPRSVTLAVGGLSAVLLVAGGLVLYDRLGAPGYPDFPRAQRIADSEAARNDRMGQAEAEVAAAAFLDPIPEAELPDEVRELISRLRQIVPTRPEDLRGWELLSEHEARLGNYAAAARAQEQVLVLKGDAATPADRTALVDRLVSATGGIISPESEALVRGILEVDEGNTAARYYLGLLYFQTDRPDIAFRLWRDLAEQADPASPHLRLARAAVDEAAFRAGIDYTLPERETGPSPADVAAMADLSPEDRSAMIEGMVARLSDRLASEGGPVEDWARLITALSVLGDMGQAEAIWREAMGVFSASDDAMALLSQTAEQAGLSP